MLTKKQGYTLLELLIALFIFTFVALMAGKGLHSVISSQAATEQKAKELREFQLALLYFSRDLGQALDNPLDKTVDSPDSSFSGTPTQVRFTHLGLSNPQGTLALSAITHTTYLFTQGKFLRDNRVLINPLHSLAFRYLDRKKRFHLTWPAEENPDPDEKLPRAVEITLHLDANRSLKQLYLLPQQEVSHAPH